jgi:DNA invertase Pin-like site-specific DNA recombinase
MKLVGLCRVSTDEQDNGIEVQKNTLQSYADKHGHELLIIKEEHVSGGEDFAKRPILIEALAMLKPGMGLLVSKRDRLARDTDIAGYISYVIRSKKAFLLVADRTNGDDPKEKFMSGLLDHVAEYEKAMIRSRIQAVMDMKKSKGERVSRHAPYGYHFSADKKSLEPDAAEQAIIAKAKKLYAKGNTYEATLKKLGKVSRNGTIFAPSALHKILHAE